MTIDREKCFHSPAAPPPPKTWHSGTLNFFSVLQTCIDHVVFDSLPAVTQIHPVAAKDDLLPAGGGDSVRLRPMVVIQVLRAVLPSGAGDVFPVGDDPGQTLDRAGAAHLDGDDLLVEAVAC